MLDASCSQKSNEYIGEVNSRAEFADAHHLDKSVKKKIYHLKKLVKFFFDIKMSPWIL